jgi:serine-type D-Ala-D-Ala carboxypeptidase (penicillin-binding protein 5/6)
VSPLRYCDFSEERTSRRLVKLHYFLRNTAIITVLAVCFVAFPHASVWSFSPDEDLTARAAILIDATTGKILYQKEPDLRLPPASTTKVVSAILTLESGRKLQESLLVSRNATRVPASKLYLRPGQTMTIEDLLYGILLASANDASIVLAEGIGGSVDNFALKMTKKAHEIGAINSHFTNPHGLTEPDHYSTAKDIAVLFRYAMRNLTFREIIQTKFSSVISNPSVKKKSRARRISVRNHNRLLWNFDGALGGKTGYTHAAQKCFVGAVRRNGVTLIVSILGAKNLWGDTKKLLAYGFDNYQGLKEATQREGRRTTGELIKGETETFSPPSVSSQDDNFEASSLNGYVLQIGTFLEQERAESLLKQFTERGFEAFVEKISLSGGQTAFRVRIGPYTTLPAAQETAQEILNHSGHKTLILPLQIPREDKGGAS